jgi:hypothetical protein
MNLLTAIGGATYTQFLGKTDVKIKLCNHTFKHGILLAEIKGTTILVTNCLCSHVVLMYYSVNIV